MKIEKSKAQQIAAVEVALSVGLIESDFSSVRSKSPDENVSQSRETAADSAELTRVGNPRTAICSSASMTGDVVPFSGATATLAEVVRFPEGVAPRAARGKSRNRREKAAEAAQQEFALPGAEWDRSKWNVEVDVKEVVATRGLHIGRDFQNGTDEWLTSRIINEGLMIKDFDLDPCAPHPDKLKNLEPGLVPAKNHYWEGGLEKPWFGKVFCNPPYSDVGTWLAKCAEHKNALALVYARMETQWFQAQVWDRATALLFPGKRVHFVSLLKNTKSAGVAPSVVVAYNLDMAEHLRTCPVPGNFILLDRSARSRGPVNTLAVA
jgi:hypothetical protein